MDMTEAENPFAPSTSAPFGEEAAAKNYYQILEVREDANRAQIRSAYIRMKSSLGVCGSATYSLLDSDDQSSVQKELEEAYRTLDDEYLRRQYDAGLLGQSESKRQGASVPARRASCKVAEQSHGAGVKERVQKIIAEADGFNGEVLRKIRLEVGVEPEQVLSHLKISVFYLKVLEEDDFGQLPPLVYVRGFLKSLVEYLGVCEAKELVDGYSRNLQEWKKKNQKK